MPLERPDDYQNLHDDPFYIRLRQDIADRLAAIGGAPRYAGFAQDARGFYYCGNWVGGVNVKPWDLYQPTEKPYTPSKRKLDPEDWL